MFAYELEGLKRLNIQAIKWGSSYRVKVRGKTGKMVYVSNLSRPTNQKLVAKQYKVSIEALKKHMSADYKADPKYRFYNGKQMEFTNSLEPTIDGTYMPFTTARLYVPFVHLENPQAIIFKPVKKVRYNDCYAQWFNQRAGTGKSTTQLNASFDLQLSASVKNAEYVVVLPFAEQTGSFVSATVQEFQSPFDSAPWTVQPGPSIRNFNVRIGSTQVFDISHDYDFHQFTNEIAKIGAINGDLTPELVNGLLDYQTWSLTNRMLIADVSRLTERDVPQSIQIQGTNAGCQDVNLLVLIISEQELSYDRLTGEVLDFTTA